MSNEQIMQELLLKFKGTGKSAKIPLIEQIRDIVGVLNFDPTEAIEHISSSDYFTFLDYNTVSLTDKGFEYVNQN